MPQINSSTEARTVSCRDFLNIAAVGAGAAFAVRLMGAQPATAGSIPQTAAGYQGGPKGGQRCGNCTLFQGPASCKLVGGTIAPQGWCPLYVQKKG